ncbi:hypothetical protein DSCO28_17870 [Desulfosarcina ovata subsp. sediminis]|uniref:Ammonium transporter n=1 Tax=Desulfosarcina ovata subsp. sediminis TaxID=885957 RepID=A0A5K7ZK03_9BACT|nr:ammonium transporter [Desulfosarcina ovata]BBO81221.1 hypothetical protein DSCO28_17870 [Desulfosarcina ovata subsp. sediminis]
MNDAPLIDIFWIVFSASLVFLMQPGFMCLESGLTRSKNSINVAVKNLADFSFSVLGFWAVGYAIMFGTSQAGLFGNMGFFFSMDQGPFPTAFFFFQVMFCGTATTIFSGAVAERMKFSSYLVIAGILAIAVYPVFGHWAWNGLETGKLSGWLGSRGFVDFAGSTVVHSVGGWLSLAALLVIGPRSGRFPKNGPPREITAFNLPLSILGVMLLWFGWFGFNGGSTLALDGSVAGIIAKTTLAAGTGAAACILYVWYRTGLPKVTALINGSLGGLVAITAGCHCVSSIDAAVVGAVSGLVCVYVEQLLFRLKVDDAVGAVPVHLGCGIWGTLAVALFGDAQRLGTGLSFQGQFVIQMEGIVAAFLIAFVIPYMVIKGIDRIWPMRVSREEEEKGLNVSEHGATTELHDLFEAMDYQTKTGDLSVRVPVEPFTEVGQIAKKYNHVMTALELASSKIEHQHALFQELFDSSPLGIIMVDAQGRIVDVNEGFAALFGYLPKDLRGRSDISLLVPEHLIEEAEAALSSVLKGKTLTRETIRKDKAGRLIDVALFIYPILVNDEIQGAYYIYNDITQRKEFETQLSHQAFHDALTGLPNRMLFLERLSSAVHRKKRKKDFTYAAMMLDMDRFKSVNDTLGHQIGDAFLIAVADRIKACLRDIDTVARLGGDEFGIILEDFNHPREIVDVAKRIMRELEKPVVIETNEIRSSASVGIVLKTQFYQDAKSVMRDADIAMYRAKEIGKACFKVFNNKMHTKVVRENELERELRDAVFNEELAVYYQPIVSVRETALLGFEALVRWNHPTQGLISPAEFIPVAEETGQIVDIGEYVLKEACRQMVKWQKLSTNNGHLTISVNVSAKQFQSSRLVKFVEEVLDETGLAPESLKLELTESTLMRNARTSIRTMQGLKDMGIRIVVDDFGTGYSSLSYIQRFPIDGLKIDRSFISGGAQKENPKIVQTIVALAKSIGVEVVAEGVEEQVQLELLKAANCESAQGFMFSKPLDEKEITRQFIMDLEN